jgi:hypothetical protein
MKASSSWTFGLGLFLVLLLSFSVSAQQSAYQKVVTTNGRQLPYGVADVIKLAQAGISEEIIFRFVQSSGTAYQLQPADIVLLRDRGVSDRVIGAMLDQKALNTLAPSPPATQQQAPSAPSVAVSNPQPKPVSTVHVIPNPTPYYRLYGPYGPYGPYYGYRYRPCWSWGVSFGGPGFYFRYGGPGWCY